MKKLLSTILIASNFVFAQQNTKYSLNENALKDIHIFNKDSAIVVGIRGKVLKTFNSGDDWIFQDLPIEGGINKVHFVNNRIGWGVGENGTIIKTVDSGDNWHILNFELNNIYFQSVCFTNDQNGWVTGQGGKIFKTSDGGDSWIEQESGTRDHLFAVFFINDSTGFIAGGAWSYESSIILKTVDSGDNWINVFDDWRAPFCNVFFINDSIGWVVGDEAIIMKTKDGGNNWERQQCDVWEIFLSAYFLNEQTGWIVGSRGLILETKNGGINWEINSYQTTDHQFNCIHFSDNEIGWIVGTNSTINRTADSGQNWSPQTIQSMVYISHSVDVKKCILLQNYPNPINPSTTIRFELPIDSDVSMEIIDLLGRRVRALVDEQMDAGEHSVMWDGRTDSGIEAAAGIYFARLRAEEETRTIKLLLVK
jgi:photosystem II stability/assembly factor-like uncharacterized protein